MLVCVGGSCAESSCSQPHAHSDQDVPANAGRAPPLLDRFQCELDRELPLSELVAPVLQARTPLLQPI